MPIVSVNDHPSLSRIANEEGLEVINVEKAIHQDIRELHIGFLNMMPDNAFLATERQFFRLIAASNRIVHVYLHPIKSKGVKRSAELADYIDKYYRDFADIKAENLDALIVTGANPTKENITDESYWQHATEIFAWADDNVASVFFSCLASHAMLQENYQIERQPLKQKLWGVFPHKVQNHQHPLVSNINTRFDMPHSRNNDVTEADFISSGMQILVKGDATGVALATSKNGISQVFCQGHPEYDTFSLLKEYKREVGRYINDERSDYPVYPQNYLSAEAEEILAVFREQLLDGEATLDDFPEQVLVGYIDNTWRDTAKSIFSNWLGVVYQIINVDRTKKYMDGVDPTDPLAILRKK